MIKRHASDQDSVPEKSGHVVKSRIIHQGEREGEGEGRRRREMPVSVKELLKGTDESE